MTLPHSETTPKLSLLNVHNLISEFGLTVHKEMDNRHLRLSNAICCRSINDLLKSYCQVLENVYSNLKMLTHSLVNWQSL